MNGILRCYQHCGYDVCIHKLNHYDVGNCHKKCKNDSTCQEIPKKDIANLAISKLDNKLNIAIYNDDKSLYLKNFEKPKYSGELQYHDCEL